MTFPHCEICGADDWTVVHEGRIRRGGATDFIEGGRVGRCAGCGVTRLDEACSVSSSAYENTDYRSLMNQGVEPEDFFANHDVTQIHNLRGLWPHSLRGKTIADIGCGAGSFLDFVSGPAAQSIAVEPTAKFHDSLSERGYKVYSYARQVADAAPHSVDFVSTFQVIEHVENPVQFLKDIKAMLKPDGTLLVATPNLDDILMTILPEEFSPFYYRMVHRWYFTMDTLIKTAELAGFEIQRKRYLHTFGMANTLVWLRDKLPKGDVQLKGITEQADDLWRIFLESTGQSDTIYITFRPT
ncbi:MAG: class I SAM-dependent methyltransferase [Alphaproteobacteria bacterium]|nr:class I SAM-dependent methyltransferase [Alphaproteobacteria bacterium]